MNGPTIAALTGIIALVLVAVAGVMVLKSSEPSKSKTVLVLEVGENDQQSYRPNQQALADFGAYKQGIGYGYYPLERRRKRKARKTRKNVA